MLLSIAFVVNQSFASENKLPSEAEVIATGHPLTLSLYVSYKRYEKNPKMGTSRDLGECLRQHPLLDSPWVHEKGFAREIEEQYNEGNATTQAIESTICKNKNYAGVPEITQKLLMANLMGALKDCSARHSSK